MAYLFAILGGLLLSLHSGAAETTTAQWPPAAAEAEQLFTADGYRQARYRAPTPEQTDGAVTLETSELQQLLAGANPPLLLDVRPLSWKAGRFIKQKDYQQLPGSLWLPNVGYGEPEPAWLDYFQRNLQRLRTEQPARALVFYCRADCWMSWNAARRAHQWGYGNLYWYRDGIDGWREAELPLTSVEPVPYP
ncbi:rhodanese-like domain-containing protein [Marinobacterium arenosum]|uniref:rhodanese-like domain-containing protein n=1 Tax=Marinobacterium arenosum TaxID=2862496 RepID=UPI001C9486FB|nr:rhodanese-like domain-containing protein [Marinobacterium arenosum]MBY4675864.1 hypothetical protein [Marinobacterium arenosum]